eukprot:gnl/TRDRNA2_/TRDRNA2_80489_c0_seq1.p1 gnl/TRDRNA2_/TRDRNA2_80489_c0~~gnl/TRDRNA2_/TRDRNA2_80489_c0_seq1.p1  ORF type:complete len:365 (-),score=63.62 gnl/TRDRNA2_/TRDRNA2_80489_c0_seq1:27-1121(-)
MLPRPRTARGTRQAKCATSAAAAAAAVVWLAEAGGSGAAVLSWARPRVFVFDQLLSEEECSQIIALGRDRLKPAQLAQGATGAVDRSQRRNEQMFFDPQEAEREPILEATLDRLHRAALLPPELGESLQLGRYSVGDFYAPHYDTPQEVGGLAATLGGVPVRVATVLVYVSNVTRGGQTLFLRRPLRSDGGDGAQEPAGRWDHCGDSTEALAACCKELDEKEHDVGSDAAVHPLLVRPAVGRAVLFFHHDWEGEFDATSAHAACPVVEGEKWVLQRFIRLHAPPQRSRGASANPRLRSSAGTATQEPPHEETPAERFERRLKEEEAKIRDYSDASSKRSDKYERELQRLMAEGDAYVEGQRAEI